MLKFHSGSLEKVLFTDESKFETYGSDRRVHVRKHGGSSLDVFCLLWSWTPALN